MAGVLVVDDDPVQLEIRRLVLERKGHTVYTAGNTVEAWDNYCWHQPKLVILDLRLPRTEDGLGLIRRLHQAGGTRLLVLSGWAHDLDGTPESAMVDHVLMKPVQSGKLLDMVAKLTLCLLALMNTAPAQSTASFPFQVDAAAEVVAEMDLSAPGADWGRAGREGVLVNLSIDDGPKQQVMIFSGDLRHRYRAFLGEIAPGAHVLKLERHPDSSARGVPMQPHGVTFRQYKPSDPEYAMIANAPVLFARPNTIGKFTDIPLLAYCEKLPDGSLRYSVIFSNEDGGTSTRALMARWGRVTDIEHVYQVWPATKRTLIQTKGHNDVEFHGRYEGLHPLLAVSTNNNMVSDQGSSAVRYQLAPIAVELGAASRERVMDENPIAYLVAGRELEREGKLRDFGKQEGTKISNPENYLIVEMRLLNKDARVALLVRLNEDKFFRLSSLGVHDMGIERSGWVRTAIELPPATQPAQVVEIGFQCMPEVKAENGGQCRVEAISKMFFLNAKSTPDASFWRPAMDRGPWIIPSGQIRTVPMR
ncbi:MAG: response regulator [Bryobacterales bacterium]|nr:response regulator [Bryobacterales bacterium]